LKICAIADLHGYLPEIPDCDLLLIAGDICPHKKEFWQYHWLITDFKPWLESLKMPVIGVAGNHDWPFQNTPKDVAALQLPWTYLQDSETTFNGLKIYGSPYSKQYYEWAFMLEEFKLAGKWNQIPDDTDILIVHGPPKYYGDLVLRGSHEGSESLTWRIIQVKPKLVVFGHIHEGRGEWQYGDVHLANVTLMGKTKSEHHDIGVYEPWTTEIETPSPG